MINFFQNTLFLYALLSMVPFKDQIHLSGTFLLFGLFLAVLHFLLLHITAHLSHIFRCVHRIPGDHFNETESFGTFLFSLDYSLIKLSIGPDRNGKRVASKRFGQPGVRPSRDLVVLLTLCFDIQIFLDRITIVVQDEDYGLAAVIEHGADFLGC